MDLNDLRSKARTLEPVIRIGKFGLNDGVYIEIEKLLKKRKLIKIKILNNCSIEDHHEMVNQILIKTHAVLISHTGNMFCIYRESSVFR